MYIATRIEPPSRRRARQAETGTALRRRKKCEAAIEAEVSDWDCDCKKK
jgi:hypothetical protein